MPMEAARFDALSRAASRATSRRRALAILAGGAAAVVLPGVFRRRAEAAAAPGPERPAAAAAPFCQESNLIAPRSYEEMAEYIIDCGIRCPDGSWIPRAFGCSQIDFRPDPPVRGPITWSEDPLGGGVCASQPVTVNWRVLYNTFTALHVVGWNACCRAECDAELERWMFETYVHEQAHVDRQSELIARANVEWTDHVVSACGPDRTSAAKELGLRITRQVQADWNSILETIGSDPEPYIGPKPAREPCVLGGECGTCVDGRCRMCEGQCCPPAVHFDKCCPTGMYCCGVGCCFNSESCCAHLPGGQDRCCPAGSVCVDVGGPHPWCEWRSASAGRRAPSRRYGGNASWRSS
jgi:hypothetical protein